MKQRYVEIDILRGVSIVTMILIHITAYYRSDKLAVILWDWAHFATAGFLFSSSYLFFKKYLSVDIRVIRYLKSRAVRLLRPYYQYLIIFLFITYWFTPVKLTASYIFQSIFVIGGANLTWLIMLFLFLAVVNPLLLYLYKKRVGLLALLTFLTIANAALFLVYVPSISWRISMLLPWTIISLFALYIARNEENSFFFPAHVATSSISFILTYYLMARFGQNLILIDNKYPPNFYFLLYGVWAVGLIYYLARYVKRIQSLTSFLTFFSVNSYSLFFTHYLVMITLARLIPYSRLNWVQFFLIVVSITLIFQFGFIQLQKRTGIKVFA